MTLREALSRLWQDRPCFVCGRRGFCGHRELELYSAMLEHLAEADPDPRAGPAGQRIYECLVCGSLLDSDSDELLRHWLSPCQPAEASARTRAASSSA